MTADEIAKLFHYFSGEGRHEVRYGRDDAKLFAFLAKLFPKNKYFLQAAAHDVIFLSVTTEDLANALVVRDDILNLCSLGVHLSSMDGETLEIYP